MIEVSMYVDGSCIKHGTPEASMGVGGRVCINALGIMEDFSENKGHGTNNQAELMAVESAVKKLLEMIAARDWRKLICTGQPDKMLELRADPGLSALSAQGKDLKNFHLTIYSDSQYTIGCLSNPNWKPRENVEIINRIKAELRKFGSADFRHVKGHSKHLGNQFADALARKAAQGG